MRLLLPSLILSSYVSATAALPQAPFCLSPVPYGNNPAAAHTAAVNSIKVYYETYGNGPVLLLIHGNGGSIAAMRCQISFFAKSYRVIIVDSRAHGKSQDGTGPLTYDQIASDLSVLLQQLKRGPIDVIGWSDGGIIALLLAIQHPEQIKSIVADAPNLRPDSTAIFSGVLESIRKARDQADAKLAQGDRSQNWTREKRWNQMMLDYPHIPLADLHKIKAPTLVMGGDADMIPPEHLLEIYRNIPTANLYIAPGATHHLLQENPDLFNAVTARFLKGPFQRPPLQH